MKGILAEPGKAPVIASLPDSLWAIENRLGTPCEMIVMPRTPAVLFVGRYDGCSTRCSWWARLCWWALR